MWEALLSVLNTITGGYLDRRNARKLARRSEVSPALHTLEKAIRKAIKKVQAHINASSPPGIEPSDEFIETLEDLKIDIPDEFYEDIECFINALIELEADINFPVRLDKKSRSDAFKRRGFLLDQLSTMKEEIRSSIKNYLS